MSFIEKQAVTASFTALLSGAMTWTYTRSPLAGASVFTGLVTLIVVGLMIATAIDAKN